MSIVQFFHWQRIRSLGLHLIYFCLFILAAVLVAAKIKYIEYFILSLFLSMIIFELHSYFYFLKDKGKASYNLVSEIEEIKLQMQDLIHLQGEILETVTTIAKNVKK
jgi:hypothetical protein